MTCPRPQNLQLVEFGMTHRFIDPPLSGFPFFGSATGIIGLPGRRKGEKQAEEEERKEEEEEEEEKGEARKMGICITQTL